MDFTNAEPIQNDKGTGARKDKRKAANTKAAKENGKGTKTKTKGKGGKGAKTKTTKAGIQSRPAKRRTKTK